MENRNTILYPNAEFILIIHLKCLWTKMRYHILWIPFILLKYHKYKNWLIESFTQESNFTGHAVCSLSRELALRPLAFPIITARGRSVSFPLREPRYMHNLRCFLLYNVTLGMLSDYSSMMFCLHWQKIKYARIVNGTQHNANSLFIIIWIYLILLKWSYIQNVFILLPKNQVC